MRKNVDAFSVYIWKLTQAKEANFKVYFSSDELRKYVLKLFKNARIPSKWKQRLNVLGSWIIPLFQHKFSEVQLFLLSRRTCQQKQIGNYSTTMGRLRETLSEVFSFDQREDSNSIQLDFLLLYFSIIKFHYNLVFLKESTLVTAHRMKSLFFFLWKSHIRKMVLLIIVERFNQAENGRLETRFRVPISS